MQIIGSCVDTFRATDKIWFCGLKPRCCVMQSKCWKHYSITTEWGKPEISRSEQAQLFISVDGNYVFINSFRVCLQPEERPSKLSPSLKLVIVLSLLVISSTFPMALIFSFDIVPSARSAFHHSIGFLAYTCLSLYVITCPIFMVKYLADLKTSTNQLLLRCISRHTKAARSHGNADSRRGDDITN